MSETPKSSLEARSLQRAKCYKLAEFGSLGNCVFSDKSLYVEAITTLAARLRYAAVMAKLCPPGSSVKIVYQAVKDWLVGECGLGAKEADRLAVAEVIARLNECVKTRTAGEPGAKQTANVGECDKWYPAKHYEQYNIAADTLRQAAHDDRIHKRKGNGNRNEYLDADVRRCWPHLFLRD